MATTEPQVGDEKFLGALIGAVTTVAPHVLPHVMRALRKEYEPSIA